MCSITPPGRPIDETPGLSRAVDQPSTQAICSVVSPKLVSAGMDELPDDVMAEIREYVQAGQRAWEDTLREREEQRLLEAVFGGEREH
jgi:hypothetical protein